jgi:uncharacterized protein YdaU (DUF1376 family)
MPAKGAYMAEFPALPLFTDAYLADTRHLTTLQHGAYLLMLMTAWRTSDCSLQHDDVYLARICGMDKRTWQSNKTTLLSFWRIGDDAKIRQGRLEDERNYVDQKRNKNSEAGKASALKRKNRDSTGVQPNVNQTSTPTPTPTPNGIDKSIPKKARERKRISLDELGISHIAEWLAKKRTEGKYTHHNEIDILEYFKTYCESKNKRYDDYVAALRLSFDWERNQPKGNTNGRQSTFDTNRSPVTEYRNKDQRAKEAVARAAERLGFAPWQQSGGEASTNDIPSS